MEGDSQVPLPTTGKGECSEATVEIKIKTLDSQTYTLRVNKFVSVPALKEQIANVTGVLSNQQRLICRGKVLKDDELLSSYHVEDGHTLHLVVRQPIDPQSSTPGITGIENGSTLPGTSPLGHGHAGHNLIFGAVNLSGPGYPSTPDLSRILSTVISSLGGSNIDVESMGIGSREQGYESLGRSGHGGSPDSSQTQADQTSAGVEFDQHQDTAQPTVIPDSLITLSQYINHLQQQFDSLGPSSNSTSQGCDRQDHVSNSAASQGLPTPAALAGVALSGRQLLMEQAARCLSELASQLQSQVTVFDTQTRSSMQSYSMSSGALLQNLGSLLLELGRTIMTVRMGQTPDAAVVNAGPAIFVSASSPNPIMVQASIGLSGSGPSGSHTGHVLSGGLGNGILSRNIDIRIRRGNSVPVVPSSGPTNGSNPSHVQQTSGGPDSHTQQASGRPDSLRSTVDNLFQQIFPGISSSTAPSSGESTVRVVPIRTVIAIPAGVSRPSSDSSGTSDLSLHPLLARFQEQFSGGLNDARRSSISADNIPFPAAHDQHTVPSSTSHRPTSETMTGDIDRFPSNSSAGVSFPNPTNEAVQLMQGDFLSTNLTIGIQNEISSALNQSSEEQQGNEMPMSELLQGMGIATVEIEGTMEGIVSNENDAMMNPERQEAQLHDNEDGIFFSSLLRQLMPFISQGSASQSLSFEQPSSSVEQTERQQSDAVNRRDPPNDPATKRQKTE